MKEKLKQLFMFIPYTKLYYWTYSKSHRCSRQSVQRNQETTKSYLESFVSCITNQIWTRWPNDFLWHTQGHSWWNKRAKRPRDIVRSITLAVRALCKGIIYIIWAKLTRQYQSYTSLYRTQSWIPWVPLSLIVKQ